MSCQLRYKDVWCWFSELFVLRPWRFWDSKSRVLPRCASSAWVPCRLEITITWPDPYFFGKRRISLDTKHFQLLEGEDTQSSPSTKYKRTDFVKLQSFLSCQVCPTNVITTMTRLLPRIIMSYSGMCPHISFHYGLPPTILLAEMNLFVHIFVMVQYFLS